MTKVEIYGLHLNKLKEKTNRHSRRLQEVHNKVVMKIPDGAIDIKPDVVGAINDLIIQKVETGLVILPENIFTSLIYL